MFEITTLAAKDTFTLELLNGNDEPLLDSNGKPLSVTVYGPGSKAYQKANSQRTQRMLDRMAKKARSSSAPKSNSAKTPLSWPHAPCLSTAGPIRATARLLRPLTTIPPLVSLLTKSARPLGTGQILRTPD